MNKKYLNINPTFFAAVVFSAFYFISTSNGMNYTADSHHYINIAEQIYQNGFISIWKNEQLVYWPPLYPLALCFISNFGGPLTVKILHYLLALSLLLIWGKLATNFLKGNHQKFYFLLLFALSTNLLMISVFIWSELLFSVFFGLFLICLQNYLVNKKIHWLVLSILPAFLMLIVRNAGIFLYVGVILSILIYDSMSRRHFYYIILSSFFSVSGFAIWNFKNIVVEDRFYMIAELLPFFTPIKNSTLILNEVGAVFFPSLVLYPFSIVLSILLIYFLISHIKKSPIFHKIIFSSTLLYLMIWIIIPGDPSNMGRFISVIAPPILLWFIGAFLNTNVKILNRRKFKIILMVFIVSYSILRISNNSLLWGGQSKYKNFGEMHKNIFYEKSDRIIGVPPQE